MDRMTLHAEGTDILGIARRQVLERGEPLTEPQVLDVLQTADEQLDDLLALAHAVRMKWCGPDVEVEGIVSLKTGGCPEDCHFCSQSGQFTSPVRSVGLTSPSWSRRRRRPAPRAPASSASWPPSEGQTTA